LPLRKTAAIVLNVLLHLSTATVLPARPFYAVDKIDRRFLFASRPQSIAIFCPRRVSSPAAAGTSSQAENCFFKVPEFIFPFINKRIYPLSAFCSLG
jgi:hypothetical protein